MSLKERENYKLNNLVHNTGFTYFSQKDIVIRIVKQTLPHCAHLEKKLGEQEDICDEIGLY